MKKMRPKPLLSTHLFSDFQTMWDVISSSLHFPWVSFWRKNVPSVLTHFLQEKDHDTIMQSWIILKRDTYSKENVSNPNFLLFDPPQPQGPMYLLLTLGKWGSKWGDFHWAMGCVYSWKRCHLTVQFGSSKRGSCYTIICSNHKIYYLSNLHYRAQGCMIRDKNLEEKDGQRQLLYYVSLIRACNKVLYQLVYIHCKCLQGFTGGL